MNRNVVSLAVIALLIGVAGYRLHQSQASATVDFVESAEDQANQSTATEVSLNKCRQLGRGDTVVIIEGNRGDSDDRDARINEVVNGHNLKGEYCQSVRNHRVWMSKQMSGADEAIKVFDYFRAAGLIEEVGRNKPTNQYSHQPLPTN